MAGDEYMIGAGFRDARGDRADTDLGDELDRDARIRIRAPQVVDQLLELLARVDVVMRRRRDQADTRRRQTHACDIRVDLVAGELTALAGLRALRHLDLQLVGVRQVGGGDTETARCDLLDLRTPVVAVALGILAAFAGVRAPADAVHRARERLVRLARDRTERHSAGREALHDLRRRLDLVERDAAVLGEAEAEEAAQGGGPGRIRVACARELLVRLEASRAHRVLWQRDR